MFGWNAVTLFAASPEAAKQKPAAPPARRSCPQLAVPARRGAPEKEGDRGNQDAEQRKTHEAGRTVNSPLIESHDTMNIFVSSVKGGLEVERQAVCKQILSLGDHPIAMEYFSASTEPPLDECLAQLDDTDMMVLLLGASYGSIHAATRRSYTHNEFKHANTRCIDVLAFAVGNLEQEIDEKNTPENARLYREFLEEVRSRVTYASFASVDKLAAAVVTAIHNYKAKHGELGRRVRPFLKWNEYFAESLKATNYLRHTWELVGREGILAELQKFIDGHKKVGTLYGPGGSGKSRILLEYAQILEHKAADWDVLFLSELYPWSDETPKALPAHKCLIVADDAQRSTNLEAVLGLLGAQQYAERTKLLLTARQSGRDFIRAAVSLKVDVTETEDFGIVPPLGMGEIRQLASQALGDPGSTYLERLVWVSADCPLVTVVGGQLIAQKQIRPELFERDEDFRRAVLDRFHDELTKALGDDQVWKDILALVSALCPVRPKDPNFRNAAADFLQIQAWDLMRRLGIIEANGLLLRRGGLVRIMPDVLADHLLFKACVNEANEETGYARAVFDKFAAIQASHLLRNLSELQWRIDQTGGTPRLLESIWDAVKQEFRSADYFGRLQILEIVESAAVFQPAPALELVRDVLAAEVP
jgi:uncharacterized protein DUF4062